MAFTIKAAKPRKRGKGQQSHTKAACNSNHCTSIWSLTSCTSNDCQRSLQLQLDTIRNDSLAVGLAYDSRIDAINKMDQEIRGYGGRYHMHCRAATYETFEALEAARALRAAAHTCGCTSCLLETQKHSAQLLNHKMVGAENYISDLRNYVAANDPVAEREPLRNNFGQGKYFTRQGTYRGHGATALKPKLQMQNSYNVAALTTNSMITRPIKTEAGKELTVREQYSGSMSAAEKAKQEAKAAVEEAGTEHTASKRKKPAGTPVRNGDLVRLGILDARTEIVINCDVDDEDYSFSDEDEGDEYYMSDDEYGW